MPDMTVKSLIEKLQQLPPETGVEIRLDYQDANTDTYTYIMHFDNCAQAVQVLGDDE